jgi:tRNA 2-selenouridine synthase
VSQPLEIKEFLSSGLSTAIIDVRTPAEFVQGHIPGAVNVPLFSNEERAVVGTIYKHEGRQAAILKGLEFVGPKMADIVSKAQELAKNNTVCVHCWRGGMRSGSVAWLLRMYGLNVHTLQGGYKKFRQLVLSGSTIVAEIKILGGRTGSGKTIVLQHLAEMGQAIIDIEKLAHHKGSAFGGFGQVQLTQEQFENNLFMAVEDTRHAKTVWLEDESRLLGTKAIPLPIWEKMRLAEVIYIDIPFEARAKKLLLEYGPLPKEQLEEAITRISRRMGPEQSGHALFALHAGDLEEVCRLCLEYYDKGYDHGLKKREGLKLKKFTFTTEQPRQIAEYLIKENSLGTQTHGI